MKPRPTRGRNATGKKYIYIYIYIYANLCDIFNLFLHGLCQKETYIDCVHNRHLTQTGVARLQSGTRCLTPIKCNCVVYSLAGVS